MKTNEPISSAIDGETRLFFIVGDPIAQVGSPMLFNSLFQQHQIRAAMLPCHVLPADLGVVIKGLRRQQNLGGIIVTVPHKVRVRRLIDSLTPEAIATGAVNAIRRNTDGSLHGANFDGRACIRTFQQLGADLRNQSVLIIGAGGAGRAVADACLREGANRLRIVDKTSSRAVRLARELKSRFSHTVIDVGDRNPNDFTRVINCSPSGMTTADAMPIDVAQLDAGTAVVDLVLKPVTPPMLKAAQDIGCRTANGNTVLSAQVDLIADFFLIDRG